MASKLKIHDTCGVNNLHGMPGLLAGIAGTVAAALATTATYGNRYFNGNTFQLMFRVCMVY